MGPMAVTRTACSYCGVGCGIEVQTTTDSGSGRPVIARVSGDNLHPTNFGRLCTKGATHAEMMAADDGRLKSALLRTDARRRTRPRRRSTTPLPRPADGCARSSTSTARTPSRSTYPASCRFEAQYLANKLAKGFVGTGDIESNSRLCMASAGGFKLSLGADGPPGSYADFDCADVFLVIGANMADCHPDPVPADG